MSLEKIRLVCSTGSIDVEPGTIFIDDGVEWMILARDGDNSVICRPGTPPKDWRKSALRVDGTFEWCSDSIAAKLLTEVDGKLRTPRGDFLVAGSPHHLFEGAPDSRQSEKIEYPVSRFRPRYRALTDEEKDLHDALKLKAEELEALYRKVKTGRYHSLAITALEESVMWIVKELTG